MAYAGHSSHHNPSKRQILGNLSAEDGGEKASYQLSDGGDQL
jgi:hypothetical protein